MAASIKIKNKSHIYQNLPCKWGFSGLQQIISKASKKSTLKFVKERIETLAIALYGDNLIIIPSIFHNPEREGYNITHDLENANVIHITSHKTWII